jgi:hypothetical protein
MRSLYFKSNSGFEPRRLDGGLLVSTGADPEAKASLTAIAFLTMGLDRSDFMGYTGLGVACLAIRNPAPPKIAKAAISILTLDANLCA